MAILWLIRHGRTAWNEAGWIQGRADPPLSEAGRAAVQAWRLPQDWRRARWYASPLRRARETATFLTAGLVTLDERLIEMDWGNFEGRRLADLRARAPDAMAANEARGLDFRTPGGESPREVGARVRSFILELGLEAGDAVAVTHKGVIHAALALATGWDMRTKPPLRLEPDSALPLMGRQDGRLELAGTPFRLA